MSSINPAMGMGYGFGGDDFYTQMLYQQMMQNGGAANWANAGGTANNNGAANGAAQDVKQGGSSFVKTAGYAAAAGGLTGAGMLFTNNPFNSPLESGKKVFNEDFMKHFSGEYAAMQNGDKLEKFFKGLGNTKAPITVENYGSAMESIEEFIKSGDVDDLSAEAKQILKKKFSLSKADKATLEALHTGKLAEVKNFLTDTHYSVNDLRSANSLNINQSMLDSLDDVRDGWKTLGKGKDSIPAKLDYLRENAHTMGMDKADYQKLLRNADDITDVKELDDIFKKFGEKAPFKARKTALKKEVRTIQEAMQKFASKWDGKANFWGKSGFKKVGNEKTLTALESALSSMKKAKAGKYAAIAAAGAAVISFFA